MALQVLFRFLIIVAIMVAAISARYMQLRGTRRRAVPPSKSGYPR